MVLAVSPPAGATASKISRPATGIYLGAFVDPDNHWDGVVRQEGEVRTFEQHIGRKLDLDHHYYGWSGSSQMFPAAFDRWDVQGGRIPLISWEGTNLDSINSGSQDASIRARAAAVKKFGHRVFISWGYEMNGNWNPWDGYHNNSPGRTDGPAKFVAAWRRIHNIFQRAGATNVTWVWTPNDRDIPSTSWNHWTNYYPGDAYVDWVGVDGYNWGTAQSWSQWTPFGNLFTGVYGTYASRKPIMVVETASAEQGGSKAQWIRGMWKALVYQYPDIKAVVWMETGPTWKVETSASALSAFWNMATSPYFTQRKDTTAPYVSHSSVGVSSSSMDLRFRLSEPARVLITITNQAGLVVRRLVGGRALTPGPHEVRWNLRNSAGGRVRAGLYRWRIRATDPSSNVRTTSSSVRVP